MEPLASRIRPTTLKDFVGQAHLVGRNKPLRTAIEGKHLFSFILWGPPGTGKTTIARIYAKAVNARIYELSAVSAGKDDIKAIVNEPDTLLDQRPKVLFLDEIHRFNKAQQDYLLPFVESGKLTLIGATTENPSFEVISALLSRCRVFVLQQLSEEDLLKILQRALKLGFDSQKIAVDQETLSYLAGLSNGDARVALNALEFAVKASQQKNGQVVLDKKIIKESLQKSHYLYDKAGDQHYNLISALHKSVRGGNADAALYWLGRILEAGEDPLYVARRLVRMAVEDIGLADPKALEQAVAAYQGCHFLGMPECDIILAQCVVYLARAKKNNVTLRH